MTGAAATTAPDDFATRLAAVRARIASATDRPVRLVAVTKGHPVEACRTALAGGVADLGENYAQELVAKAEPLAGTAGDTPVSSEAGRDAADGVLRDGGTADGAAVPGAGAVRAVVDSAGEGPADSTLRPRWHFIGGVQRNKVRMLAPHVHLWHTVDRPELAREIANRAPGAQVLVQVDLAGTEGRSGCRPDDVDEAVAGARTAGLDVRGLMGVAPMGSMEDARAAFRSLAAAAHRLELPELSMGMSADLEIALEEGATIVRIGTDLFGPRQRNN